MTVLFGIFHNEQENIKWQKVDFAAVCLVA